MIERGRASDYRFDNLEELGLEYHYRQCVLLRESQAWAFSLTSSLYFLGHYRLPRSRNDDMRLQLQIANVESHSCDSYDDTCIQKRKHRLALPCWVTYRRRTRSHQTRAIPFRKLTFVDSQFTLQPWIPLRLPRGTTKTTTSKRKCENQSSELRSARLPALLKIHTGRSNILSPLNERSRVHRSSL